jgi:beta-lactamase superfamily II metal-dependent hydrolase
MNLTLLPAGSGDCLLVTGADGRRLLVDGGVVDSYRQYVAPALLRLREAGEHLDLVCVTRIDPDHIGGILQILDDLMAWRVHEHEVATNTDHRARAWERPPDIHAIWHNDFDELVGRNAGPIEDMLAATTSILFGRRGESKEIGENNRILATSIREALRLSLRIGPRQLHIPHNLESAPGPILVREDEASAPIQFGGMKIWVIGPFKADFLKLRDEWNMWLGDRQKKLKEIQERRSLAEGDVDRLLRFLDSQEKALERQWMGIAPNVASIALLLEEGAASVLLTGDAYADDVLRGLRHVGRLDASGGMHVSVLKVQNHGSEHNISHAFCKAITADHYVFCANGSFMNPDLLVVQAIIDSRIGRASERSTNPQATDPFTLWFNSSSATTEGGNRDHMRAIEQLVAERAAKSEGRLRRVFRSGEDPDEPGLDVLP